MTRTRRISLVSAAIVAALALAGQHTTPASAASTDIISGVKLTDASPMQGLAHDAVHGFWIIAQVTYPVGPGDITLNKVSDAGVLLGVMHLDGFGHGTSIGVEPVGSTTYVWTEAVGVSEPALGSALAGVYGTKIARFAWTTGRTITATSTGVSLFAGNQPEETPSVDVTHGLIGIHYWSAPSSNFRYVVYSLAQFKARTYAPLANVADPAYTATAQGWALSGSTIVRVEGDAYTTTTNPPPGNIVLLTMTTAGVIASKHLVMADPNLSYREPQGAAYFGTVICIGLATEPGGTFHKVTILCGP